MDKLIKILLIEDDNDDVDILKEALNDNGVSYNMEVISDGGAVNGYIEKCTLYPDIVVLDLNLPRVHGSELLKMIKNTPSFQHIPVCILTTSSAQKDMDTAYRDGADEYLIKPNTIKGINMVVSCIIQIVKRSEQ